MYGELRELSHQCFLGLKLCADFLSHSVIYWSYAFLGINLARLSVRLCGGDRLTA